MSRQRHSMTYFWSLLAESRDLCGVGQGYRSPSKNRSEVGLQRHGSYQPRIDPLPMGLADKPVDEALD